MGVLGIFAVGCAGVNRGGLLFWKLRRTLGESRTIAKSPLLPVILSGAKNPWCGKRTLRFAQSDRVDLQSSCGEPVTLASTSYTAVE